MVKKNVLTHKKKLHAYELLQQNKLAEARPLFEAVCQRDKLDLESWLALGVVLGRLDQVDKSVKCFEHILKINPKHIDARKKLATLLMHAERYQEAAIEYEEIFKLEPDTLENHQALGYIYQQLKRDKEAKEQYLAALSRNGNDLFTNIQLGLLWLSEDDARQALTYFEKCIAIDPHNPVAHNNRGLALLKLERFDDAITAFEEAIKYGPSERYLYLVHIGLAHRQANRYLQAVKYYQAALEHKPGSMEALKNLPSVLIATGQIKEAIAVYDEILAHEKSNYNFSSKRLFSLNYLPNVSPEELYKEHAEWGKRIAQEKLQRYTFEMPRDAQKKLRIGYVSPDFREHSVTYFIEPILRQHNKEQFSLFCYANLKKKDAVTQRLQSYVDGWRDIPAMSDAEVATQIHNDEIDILVDLSGHTDDSRLLVFAHKPAPIQISYLGYPNTTGLSTIDYRITDHYADPDGEEQFHTEKLLRLAPSFLCYQPPQDAPDVAELPYDNNHYITFGSFNNLSKVNERVITLWVELLQRIPTARLCLKNMAFKDPDVIADYIEKFTSQGISAERLEFIGWVTVKNSHLELYNRIDICLDTFPYNGTTTTCESLWMGVPVITLLGDRHAGRVGYSLLANTGLAQLVAEDEAAYLDNAVELATQIDSLRTLRKGLRDQLRHSPLLDGASFTRNLEKSLHLCWQSWRRQHDVNR